MNTCKTNTIAQRMILSALLAFIGMLLISGNTLAQNACKMNDRQAQYGGFSPDNDPLLWRAAASTGSIDPNDLNKVVFSGGTATFKPGVSEAVMRYNIAKEIISLGYGCQNTEVQAFRVRYFKPNADSRVIVTLQSYNLKNGQTTILGTFDSNECDNPIAASYQWRTKSLGYRTDNPNTWGDLAYFLKYIWSEPRMPVIPGWASLWWAHLDSDALYSAWHTMIRVESSDAHRSTQIG